jgi:hypothetical protein
VLDHAAAVLGRKAVERAREGVCEMRLIEQALLVQRLDQHHLRGGEAGERFDERRKRLIH